MTVAPRRRWLRFSLRTMMLLVAVVAVPLAGKFNRVRNQRAVVAEVADLNGQVIYDYQLGFKEPARQTVEPPGPRWLRELLGDDFFATVARIDIEDVPVTGATLALIATLPDLQQLGLTSNQINVTGLRHLAKLNKLEGLGLQSTSITDSSLAHLAELKGLKYLTLEGSLITDSGLVQVAKLTQLEALELHADTVTDDGLRPLAKLPNLNYLLIDCNHVTDAGLAHLHQMSNLKQLRLCHGLALDEAYEGLRKALPNCQVLQR